MGYETRNFCGIYGELLLRARNHRASHAPVAAPLPSPAAASCFPSPTCLGRARQPRRAPPTAPTRAPRLRTLCTVALCTRSRQSIRHLLWGALCLGMVVRGLRAVGLRADDPLRSARSALCATRSAPLARTQKKFAVDAAKVSSVYPIWANFVCEYLLAQQSGLEYLLGSTKCP